MKRLSLIIIILLLTGAEQKGAITVAPVRIRTFKDIMQDLAPPDQVTGTIILLDGMQLTLRQKDGTIAFVEFLTAARSPSFPPIGTGKSITAIGKLDGDGILHAYVVFREAP